MAVPTPPHMQMHGCCCVMHGTEALGTHCLEGRMHDIHAYTCTASYKALSVLHT